ncbi:hypothetical protein CXB51_034180 [Gossypium anomalum]|uniref:DUF7745 domain-containing protein n=1 Tax=Gossypium anomalum TaxID=47600 RepID=A0A8J6CEV7_9ROSI|nr:hypothetical protein CXB51_034180 [Gossypium anomalum]
MSEQWIMARIKEKGKSKCIPWGALKDLIQTHPDEAKRVDIFALSLYGLMVFPKALGYVDEATTDLFHRLSKRVTSVLVILAETFRSLNACRRASAGSATLDLQSKDVERRAPGMIPVLIGSLYWDLGCHWLCPLACVEATWIETVHTGIYGFGSEWFVYRGDVDTQRRGRSVRSLMLVINLSIKGVAISPATTPEYVEWKGRRINDNIPSQAWKELD